jgi:hypothetical protein
MLRSSKSNSKLLYEWRFTANQFVFAPSPLTLTSRYIFFQLNSYGNRPYVTSSLTRRWGCLLWICLAFRQLYLSHITCYWKFLPFAFYTSPLSVQALQSRSCLYYVSYATTAATVTSTVVNLTTTKFKPLIFSTSGFAFANKLILTIFMTSACYLHNFVI